jgi:prepilin-type N-terminal cleavage/methylation domain-containing protein
MLPSNTRNGHSLIELLIVIGILAALAGLLATRYAGRGGPGKERAATPMGRAKSVECQNNLHQVAMGLQMSDGEREGPPQDIREALRHGISQEMLRCPESRQPYRYDPRAGTVSCSTPGHESLTARVPGAY